MACKITSNPNPCVNLGYLIGDTLPKNPSFGHVSLPVKKQESSSPPLPTHSLVNISTITPSFSSNNKVNKSSFSLPQVWRQVQGSNNWEDLVEPLHPLLRKEIIRYGEFVAACYKAFNLDPNSKRYLTCKHGRNNLLKEVGLENCGYEVTKYIYAIPEISMNIPIQKDCGRWIGYVAVTNDDKVKELGRRDIVIAFRGTVTTSEWVANFMSSLTPARLDPVNPRDEVKVESGFLSLYTSNESGDKFGLGSCREQLLSEVSRLLKKHEGEEISISLTGHSMGSSLAVLLAYDLTELGMNKVGSKDVPVTVFSFGGPRVGNLGLKERCEELGVKVLRIVNVHDPITKMPGLFLNENFGLFGGKYEFLWNWYASCYSHVGVEIVLDFLDMQNPSYVHDIEAYIELLKFPTNLKKIENGNRMDLLNRAKEVILTSAEVLDILPLGDFASNLVNLVQSQRDENSFNSFVLDSMNSYIFLMGLICTSILIVLLSLSSRFPMFDA